MGLWKGKKVAVVMGGVTKEREISLCTGKAVGQALVRRGYHVLEIDAGLDLPLRLTNERIDVAFVALHGKYGEDGCVQGILEWLHIPYTGGGVMASAIGMDKVVCKRVARSLGISVAKDQVFTHGVDDPAAFVQQLSLPFPVIVKPSREGSTINATIVRSRTELPAALARAAESDATILVERYIKGCEVTVGLLAGKALPIVEIVPKQGFYNYESKYTKGMTEYIVPARLTAVATAKIQAASELICQTIGCRGTPRVDFIVGPDETPYFLEVNTVPGMTELSLVPMAAKAAGLSFDELCERILDDASLKE